MTKQDLAYSNMTENLFFIFDTSAKVLESLRKKGASEAALKTWAEINQRSIECTSDWFALLQAREMIIKNQILVNSLYDRIAMLERANLVLKTVNDPDYWKQEDKTKFVEKQTGEIWKEIKTLQNTDGKKEK